DLAQPRLDVFAQLLERVESAGVGRELVIELRQALLLDLLHAHVEPGVLTGQLLRAVVVREADRHGPLLTRAHALQLLPEAADDRDAGVRHRLLVPARQRAPNGLVEDRVSADPPQHDLGWDVALPESGDFDVAPERPGRALDLALDHLGRDLDVDVHAGVAEL